MCQVGSTHAHYYAAITLQYNHEDTVISRSVQFLLPSYKCTGSSGLQITATRLHDFKMHQITYRILKVFRGWYPDPVDWVSTPIPPSRIGKVKRWQPYGQVNLLTQKVNCPTSQVADNEVILPNSELWKSFFLSFLEWVDFNVVPVTRGTLTFCVSNLACRQDVRVVSNRATTTTTTIKLLLHPFNGLFSRTTWVSRYVPER